MTAKNQADINVIRHGDGACRVLLIHGSGSAARTLSRLGEMLVAAAPECQTHTVSLAGYGSTAADSGANIIDQHLDVLRAAMGTYRWHVVGHSMGGFLALQLALRLAPADTAINSLSLIEPMAFGVLDPVADATALAEDRAIVAGFEQGLQDGSGIAHFIAAWNQTPWHDMPEAARGHLVKSAPLIWSEVQQVSFDQTELAAYAKLKTPICLMVGADTLSPAKAVVSRLSALPQVSSVHTVEDAGHMHVLRNPQRYAPHIAAHIRQCQLKNMFFLK
ncbi:MAG: alpha/beta hydrolase [Pseudomonadota bacterium]